MTKSFAFEAAYTVQFITYKILMVIFIPMKCTDNERCSKSKVQKKTTKQEQSTLRPLQNFEVGSDVMEE